ncbi:magnesium transporter NIPA2-like isoform X2 [Sycon ciliatum]|uniref:magnesium transporter NIPA2-like isoform X2 n=1 Tax=Sycon ciliatum TaxID=27933 RepID=UPI0031F7106B
MGLGRFSRNDLATTATAAAVVNNISTSMPGQLVVTPATGASGPTDFYKGVALAVSSSAFIGASFIIKKKGLLRVGRSSDGRAGSGGYAYLREWLWWTGLLTMVAGEAANFTAYAFASAVVVTPLGGLSVIVSAILASYMLKERLNAHGKLGCFLCLIGATVVILSAPEEQVVTRVTELQARLRDAVFITYVVMVVAISTYLIWCVAPAHGNKNMLVYITICSLIGSLSVMACKGVGLAIKLTIEGDNQLDRAIVWVLVLAVISCIMVQMNYLNRALDIFNTSMVTSIYYVMFTGATITASFILFKDWQRSHAKGVIGILCGFSTIVVGVILLRFFQEVELPEGQFKALSCGGGLERMFAMCPGFEDCAGCCEDRLSVSRRMSRKAEVVRLNDVDRLESEEEDLYTAAGANGTTLLPS